MSVRALFLLMTLRMTLQTNLSGAYNVVAEQLTVSESATHVHDAITQKALELDRLHDLMKEKLANASTSEKIQIMTLAPDSWSRDHCSKFFKVSEYIVRTARGTEKGEWNSFKARP